MPRDFYEILGLTKSATADEIKKAYRKLAQKFHPDRNPGNPEAEAKYKELTNAHDVLSDPEKKKAYDLYGAAGASGFPGGGAGGFPGGNVDPRMAEELFQNLFGGGGGRGGAGAGVDFGSMFGGGGGRKGKSRAAKPQQADIETDIQVPFLKAALGGSISIDVGGRGIDVRIPAGIEAGKKLRVPASATGSVDVYLRVSIETHPYFERTGNDISVTIPISVPEAIRGAKVDVPTLAGDTLTVKVPPGTSSGSKLRLKGKGTNGGDQYLVFKIVVPGIPSPGVQDLMTEYEKLHPENPRDPAPWNA